MSPNISTQTEDRDSGNPLNDESGPGKPRKKRPGELLREGSLYSAPTIIIVFPIVGYILGWLPVKYLGWPWWVPLITMVMGLVQAIREVYSLSRKIYGDDDTA